MSRKSVLVSAPLGLGALLLLWAAMSARSEPESPPVRPRPKPAQIRKAAAIAAAPFEAPPSAPFIPAAEVPDGGQNALILTRIRLMEEKLLALEAKRDALAASNQELERQVVEKNAENSARTMAEWRVRAWEQLLGLSETQKQALLELCTKWTREDAGGRTPSRDTWLQREADLRARLSVDQAGKLHDSAAAQSEQMWRHLGRTIGGMVGASKEDQTRFQQLLGDFRAPNTMLLPEGHGADWPGMLREGSGRLQPLLSQDQLAKLNRHVQK